MRKIFPSLLLSGILIIPIIASAADISTTTTLSEFSVFATLYKVIDLIFTILLIGATIVIVVAGFMFILASGDPEKIGSARSLILYAVIGIIVALLAKGLVTIVQGLGVVGTGK